MCSRLFNHACKVLSPDPQCQNTQSNPGTLCLLIEVEVSLTRHGAYRKLGSFF